MNARMRIADWQEVHARLEQARLTMEAGGKPSQVEIARVLRERAAALAASSENTAPTTEMMELLVFSLTGERFGIETVRVLEATPLRELIPVPCTPAFVLGVVNYRGRVLTVLDMRRLLNLPTENPAKGGVVWVEADGVAIGIVVDVVEETRSVPVRKIAPPPAGLTGLRLAVTRGITEDLITVLDHEALIKDPELTINDKVA